MKTTKLIFYLSGNTTLEMKSIIRLLNRCGQPYTFYRFNQTPDGIPKEEDVDSLCKELQSQLSSKVYPVLIGWFDKYLSYIPQGCAAIVDSKNEIMLLTVAEMLKENPSLGEELVALCSKGFSVSELVAKGFSVEDIMDYAEQDFLLEGSSADINSLEMALYKGQILNGTFCCKLPEFEVAAKVEKSIAYAKWYGMKKLYESGIDSMDVFLYGSWFYYRGDENLASTMKHHVCSGLGCMEGANVFVCKYPVDSGVIKGHLDILAGIKRKKTKNDEFCSIH